MPDRVSVPEFCFLIDPVPEICFENVPEFEELISNTKEALSVIAPDPKEPRVSICRTPAEMIVPPE